MKTNNHNLTIEEYLSLPNPVISNHDGEKFRNEISGGTTRNPRWVSPRSIHRWKGFNYDLFEELFNSQYGRNLREILKIEYNFADLSDLRYPFCEVRDEDSLETLLITSIQQTVCKALHVAQSNLLGQEGRGTSQSDVEARIRQESIYMARGGQAVIDELDFDDIAPSNKPEDKESPPNKQVEHTKTAPLEEPQLKDHSPKMKSKHKPWRSDSAGVKESMLKKKPRNLLPGDTKLSTAFESKKIKTGFTGPQSSIVGSSKKPPWSYALSQIFTYCLKANVRYGYLITDQELVVIKIRPICRRLPPSALEHRRSTRLNNPQPPSDEGELKYKSIPWTHHKSDKLTINFALWALHLMAAQDGGLTEDDHRRQRQNSNDAETHDSSPNPESVNILQTPRTPFGAESQEIEASAMSQASQTRQILSGVRISDDASEGTPTGRKRRREPQEEPRSRKTRRGRRGSG